MLVVLVLLQSLLVEGLAAVILHVKREFLLSLHIILCCCRHQDVLQSQLVIVRVIKLILYQGRSGRNGLNFQGNNVLHRDSHVIPIYLDVGSSLARTWPVSLLSLVITAIVTAGATNQLGMVPKLETFVNIFGRFSILTWKIVRWSLACLSSPETGSFNHL